MSLPPCKSVVWLLTARAVASPTVPPISVLQINTGAFYPLQFPHCSTDSAKGSGSLGGASIKADSAIRRPNETRKRCKLVQSAKGSQKTLMSIGYPASGLSSICTTRCTWLKPRWVRMILRWAVKSSTCSAVKRASLYAIGWSSRSTWAFPLLNALNSRWFKGMLLGSWPFRAKTALARRFGTLTT